MLNNIFDLIQLLRCCIVADLGLNMSSDIICWLVCITFKEAVQNSPKLSFCTESHTRRVFFSFVIHEGHCIIHMPPFLLGIRELPWEKESFVSCQYSIGFVLLFSLNVWSFIFFFFLLMIQLCNGEFANMY